MSILCLTISPKTPFGTPLAGDTLFGQFCCALAETLGPERLTECLRGYVEGNPFCVVSSAMPHGHLQRPLLPSGFFAQAPDPATRKRVKKAVWLALEDFAHPVAEWAERAKNVSEILPRAESAQFHNAINRLTGTTGREGFAPRQESVICYAPGAKLDVYLCLDESRLSRAEALATWRQIGETGYGKRASSGLGKFACDLADTTLPAMKDANAFLTLAPCAPQGQEWQETRCYYKPLTRFGRHGGVLAAQGKPFKNPVLLADMAAVLTPRQFSSRPFVGQGLGGVSATFPSAVHQGYAPVVPIHLPTLDA